MKTDNIPDHVSFAVRDAWNVLPPCVNIRHPYCHIDCPHHYVCHPEYYDSDDND